MKKLREKLNEKLSKNGGFTLVEMLIVVAIIAILIAISIPMVTSSLDKAKKATDDANLRSAIGAATVEYLSAEKTAAQATNGIGTDGTNGSVVYYVIEDGQGKFEKGTVPTGAKFQYGKSGDNAGEGIYVKVSSTGEVTAQFGAFS